MSRLESENEKLQKNTRVEESPSKVIIGPPDQDEDPPPKPKSKPKPKPSPPPKPKPKTKS